jgi:hypothetical protein
MRKLQLCLVLMIHILHIRVAAFTMIVHEVLSMVVRQDCGYQQRALVKLLSRYTAIDRHHTSAARLVCLLWARRLHDR